MNNDNIKTIQKKYLTIFLITLITIIISVSLFFLNYKQKYSDLEAKLVRTERFLEDYKEKYHTYQDKANNYSQQIRFMDNYVVICPLNGTGLYHKYGCEKLDTFETSFVIYNSAQAPNRGFKPCSLCSELDNTQDKKAEIVYVTDTGSKYHRSGCSYLRSKNPITKEKAIDNGYSACSRCNP